ncbi:hypothetical protein BRADI_3g05012v3 [Brachypodium distachyon]|uniref:Uncharacterized protein n=1 Tax=Brachypodium distachyon TaxID=15368 RepID=A0A2K2CVA5_BRADI|nr:hypothetical protein BRADI_3g05012v3 [Brachypodium distachyon]
MACFAAHLLGTKNGSVVLAQENRSTLLLAKKNGSNDRRLRATVRSCSADPPWKLAGAPDRSQRGRLLPPFPAICLPPFPRRRLLPPFPAAPQIGARAGSSGSGGGVGGALSGCSCSSEKASAAAFGSVPMWSERPARKEIGGAALVAVGRRGAGSSGGASAGGGRRTARRGIDLERQAAGGGSMAAGRGRRGIFGTRTGPGGSSQTVRFICFYLNRPVHPVFPVPVARPVQCAKQTAESSGSGLYRWVRSCFQN